MIKNYSTNKAKIFFSILALLLFLFSFGQNAPKLDPAFQLLLKNKNQADVRKQLEKSVFSHSSFTSKSNNTLYSCIIYTSDVAELKAQGIQVESILPKFVTAIVTLSDLEKLQQMSAVKYVKTPKILHINNDVTSGATGASLLNQGVVNGVKYKGTGVLIGIIDTGIDWKHPDFREIADQSKSRIVKIWDQTLTPTGSENSPSGFTKGVEYTQAQINSDLSGATSIVREKDTNGHGTHVAGIAAGNGAAFSSLKYAGMAPDANLVIVKAGDGSFSQTNIIDAITYLNNVATNLGKPIVINMSLGSQGSAHDGSDDEEATVDNFSNSGAGRVVTISAGNDNGANLHKRDIINPGASTSFSFVVPSNTSASNVFTFILYSNSSQAFTGTITAPSGEVIIRGSGSDSVDNVTSSSFAVTSYNYIDSNNNNRYLYVSVSRISGKTTDAAGTWNISLLNNGPATITTDGWMYNTESSATLTNGDNSYIVGTPGNATSAITVAANVEKATWFNAVDSGTYAYSDTTTQDAIANFSSVGPRRDGAQKPDITTNGQAVVSSLSNAAYSATSGSNVDGQYYQVEQGTSMSSPAVAGAVALMLQAKPSATYSEIKSAITTYTATDVSNVGTVPNPTWGYGKLDVYKAVNALLGCSTAIRKTYAYDVGFTKTNFSGATITTQYLAEKFTPDISGKLGGVYFYTYPTVGVGSLVIKVTTNNNGVPGSILGSKTIDGSTIAKLSQNYYDLSDLNIDITSGTEYFIILYNGDTTATSWSLARDKSASGRTMLSTDAGATWTTASYNYKIRSVVYNDCSTRLATSEINKSSEVSVYPNPAIDILKIKLTKNQKSEIKIFDISGRLMKQMSADSDHIEVNVANLPKGIYLLNVVSESDKVTKKFIKN